MVSPTPQKRVLFVRCLKTVGLGVFLVSSVFFALILTANKPATATAATASTINFQARLMNASGAIVPDGNYNVRFKLYDASSGGTNLWTEDYTATSGPGSSDVRVHVANGYLSVALGSVSSFSGSIDWSQDLYLTMNIGGTGTGSFPGIGDGEMSPRIHLTAVPYAFKAGQSTQLASGNSTLSFTNPSNSNTIALPDASGTVCLQSSSSCGFAAGSGSTSYIQNTTSPQASSNFNISGTGIAGVALQTPSIDTVSGGTTLSIGTANATALTLAKTGVTTTIAGGTIFTPSSGYSSGSSSTITASLLTNNTVLPVTATTGGLTFTMPTTSIGSAGRVVYITNAGANAFLLNIGPYTMNLTTSSTATLYWNGTAWSSAGLDAGVTSVGSLDGQSAVAAGATILNNAIYLQSATASFAGLVNTGTQTFAGAKTFNALITGGAGATVTGGVLTLTGNAASALTTSSGALTLTSAAAATWSTGAGNLTLQGAGGVTVTSLAGTTSSAISVQSGNASSGASGNVTIDTGTSTSGTPTVNIGSANAKAVQVGNATSNPGVTIQSGTSNILLNTNSASATIIAKTSTNAAGAFQVQNTSSQRVFGVDTVGAGVLFGQSSALLGKMVIYNASNSNSITIQSGTTSASYTLTLPTALSGVAGDCLKDSSGTGTLSFGICGTAASTTLQNAYDNSAAASPQITLNNTYGGIKIQDSSGGVSGNLLQVQNNAASATYFGLSTGGLTMQDSSGNNAFVFDSTTSHLRIYANTTNPTLYADIYYDSVNGEAVFAASSGITRIGNGSGNITLQLANSADLLQATKTVTLGGAYSSNDFSFTRNITAGANSLTGSVVKVESTSSGSGTVASNILWLNENNTGATGNLILATTGGAGNNKFVVNTTGSVTLASGQTISSASGALSLTAGSGNLNLSAGGANKVTVSPGTNSTSSFEIQNSGGTPLLTANTSSNYIQIGSATTDSTATLLIADSYNQATDPTGVNGAMYYSTSTNRFRCYENSAWKECNHRTVIRLASDQTNLNGTANTMEDVTGLSWSVTSGTMYSFQCTIYYTSAATTTGSRWAMNGPSTTALMYQTEYTLTSTTSTRNAMVQAYDSPGTSNASSASGANMATISGYVVPSANGTMIVRHASEVSASTITAKAGSTCEWW
jgi:hypothetical protein